MVTDGLYLPVRSYAEIYCEGGNFTSCSLYMDEAQYADSNVTSPDGQGGNPNRRRNPRITRQYRIQLKKGREEECLDDAVMTVDISRGGMRLASPRSLPKGTEIFFSLKDDFLSEPVEGVGKVEWCQPDESTDLYYAGVSFSDPRLSHVVGESLIT
jgi:hypothetical protein